MTLANEAGGGDDITALVIRHVPPPHSGSSPSRLSMWFIVRNKMYFSSLEAFLDFSHQSI